MYSGVATRTVRDQQDTMSLFPLLVIGKGPERWIEIASQEQSANEKVISEPSNPSYAGIAVSDT